MFNLFKQRDNLEPCCIFRQDSHVSIDYKSPPVVNWFAPNLYTNGKLGSISYFEGIKSLGRWFPGRFRNQPCNHSSVQVVSTQRDVEFQAKAWYPAHQRYYTYPYRRISGHIAGFCMPVSPACASIPIQDSREALQLMHAIAKAKSASAEVGLMLAESAETLGMLISPFNALPKLLKRLKHPRRVSPKRALEYASNAWLTERYGIMPALADIDALRNLNNKRLQRYGPLRCSRRGFEEEISSKTTKFVGGATSSGGFYFWGQSTKRLSNHITASFHHSAVMDGRADLGLDASSIPTMLYELTPYSFVLDWFVDVGSWLRAITPSPGIRTFGTTGSTMTQSHIVSDVTHVCPQQYPTSDTPLYPCANSISTIGRAYRRTVGITPPDLPPVNVDLSSWKRQLDSVTLSFQRIKR